MLLTNFASYSLVASISQYLLSSIVIQYVNKKELNLINDVVAFKRGNYLKNV